MIVTKMVIRGEVHIVVIMDDGAYAIYHGMDNWTIHAVGGKILSQFDSFSQKPDSAITRAIVENKYLIATKIGRIV